MTSLGEAEARAQRNGLTLSVGDCEAFAWPGVRYASVALMRGREVVAAMTHSYRDDAGKQRALSICAERVYNRPVGPTERP